LASFTVVVAAQSFAVWVEVVEMVAVSAGGVMPLMGMIVVTPAGGTDERKEHQ
jgi:hypothetical protein